MTFGKHSVSVENVPWFRGVPKVHTAVTLYSSILRISSYSYVIESYYLHTVAILFTGWAKNGLYFALLIFGFSRNKVLTSSSVSISAEFIKKSVLSVST